MQIRNRFFRNSLKSLALAILAASCLNATEHHGVVKFGGQPVPGATVTAAQGDKKLSIVTDQQGAYSFPDLADGVWSFEVEMLCFAPIKQDVTVASGAAESQWELKLLSFDEIKASAVTPEPPPQTSGLAVRQPDAATGASDKTAPAANAPNAAKNAPQNAGSQRGFQRTDVNATANAPAPSAEPAAPASELAGQSPGELSQRASDGFLINGSTNNSASSPFALAAPFGNNRRGPRSLYNGNLGFTLDNSTLDASTFSLTGQDTPKPSYTRFTGLANFGGPLKIPHLLKNGPNIFVNYQWTRNRSAVSTPGLMPTAAERLGDFSQVLTPAGLPVQLMDPTTGQPLQGNIIPPARISQQAMALLNLYPLPNFAGSSRYNYQVPLVTPLHQDNMQARANKGIGRKNQLNGLFAFSSVRTDNPSIFGFTDTADTLGINSNINWRHSFTNRLAGTLGFQFSRYSLTTHSFFQNRENISGDAGISGNNQESINWGPPTLAFASGINGLGDATPSVIHNQTGALSYSMQWNRGRHNITYGGDYKRLEFNTIGQANPRGTFTFTGGASGNDFADFLFGIPDTSNLAFGNADKYFRSQAYDGYFNDDWRLSPGFTLNVGIRWDYTSPITELYGRLVNLDIAPGFTAVEPVVANDPVGSLTGQHYANSLVNPDKHDFSPRIATSWRPLPASSLVVRAGYGIYYNTSVYQSIAAQMAQQSPLSKSLSVQNSAADPLTLANGFNASPTTTQDTFAIDPNFRVGYTHTWQVSVARDLPAALIMTATYLGIKGTRAVQEFLPNTYPIGATSPCLSCPTGFAYFTSNGNSTREAGQLQLRRRLHNGFTASVQYTYAKAIDDATLGGGNQIGKLIAQNWLDLSAERGLSNFDQRHLLNVNWQYTSGMGLGGGALTSGWRAALLKEWTVLSAITVGSGLPLTPVYYAATPGTGFSGLIRPEFTGTSVYATSGVALNSAAYATPAAGEWGNAGRDSITGPYQFTLNGSLQRTFRATDRISLTLRFDVNNAINHVTYTSWITTINSPLFGSPAAANAMRSVVTTLRMGF
jgi:trimeric autotransporter adhesin